MSHTFVEISVLDILTWLALHERLHCNNDVSVRIKWMHALHGCSYYVKACSLDSARCRSSVDIDFYFFMLCKKIRVDSERFRNQYDTFDTISIILCVSLHVTRSIDLLLIPHGWSVTASDCWFHMADLWLPQYVDSTRLICHCLSLLVPHGWSVTVSDCSFHKADLWLPQSVGYTWLICHCLSRLVPHDWSVIASVCWFHMANMSLPQLVGSTWLICHCLSLLVPHDWSVTGLLVPHGWSVIVSVCWFHVADLSLPQSVGSTWMICHCLSLLVPLGWSVIVSVCWFHMTDLSLH